MHYKVDPLAGSTFFRLVLISPQISFALIAKLTTLAFLYYMMVQIKLSVVFILAAAAIAPVVGLPLPARRGKKREEPEFGALHTELRME